MVEDLIKRLKEAAQAATPQNLDTAQQVERFEDGSHITCPTCGGEGYAELNSDFCNYDGKAIGVQFYGIGPEHSAAEAYFRAASPAAILELIAMIEQQVARLTALESERDALLAAAGKGAVGQAGAMPGTDGFTMACFKASDVPIGTPLYTAPTAALENGGGRDAERWRWFMANYGALTLHEKFSDNVPRVFTHELKGRSWDEITQAIDAAMSQKAGEQQ
jgi:hypothetical protein